MSDSAGVVADPLFVGVTRPAMAFGVTYSALLVNAFVTIELFLLTRNLLWLLLALPMHALAWLLCQAEPRFFDLLLLWGRTRAVGGRGEPLDLSTSTYAPLALDRPDSYGRRRGLPTVVIADCPRSVGEGG